MDLEFSISPKITKEFILSKINQESILSYYLGITIKPKKLYCSPFRDDHQPTCGIYKASSGIVYFHDFATDKHYNCFNVVMEKYGCSYFKALKIIANDFKLVDGNIDKTEIKVVKDIDKKEITKIEVTIKDFSESELEWWNKYGITIKELRKYHVYSIENVFLNGKLSCKSTPSCPIYGYYGGKKKGIYLWRVYFPFRKSYRFMSNWDCKKIQGYKQLPKEGKLCVITKSMKDNMALHSLKIPAISPNSQTLFISDEVLSELKKRFKYIVVFYDNDRAGKYNLAKIRRAHPDLNYFIIPNSYGVKDISDFYKRYGRSKTIEFIKTNIMQWQNKLQKHLQKK